MTLSTVSGKGFTYKNRQLCINKLSHPRGAPQTFGMNWDHVGMNRDEAGEGGPQSRPRSGDPRPRGTGLVIGKPKKPYR